MIYHSFYHRSSKGVRKVLVKVQCKIIEQLIESSENIAAIGKYEKIGFRW